MNVSVEVKGLRDLQRKAEQVAEKLSDGSLVMKAALVVERQAKKNASGRPGPRVQTGRLRASITPELIDKNTARVGTNVVYAPAVEFGHNIVTRHKGMFGSYQSFGFGRRSPAYPFLGPTLQQCKGQLQGVFVTWGGEVESEWNR